MSTVVACSTPFGFSGIAIVRLTGSKAHKSVVSFIKNPPKKIRHNSPSVFKLIDTDGKIYDEAVINFMCAPKTYTGEDMVEINLHGNPTIVQKTVELACLYGASIAEGGDFTKRSFLSGKIDISQAESVASLINSKSLDGAKLSYKNLGGDLFKKVSRIKKDIVSVIGSIEFNLDISEENLQPTLFSDSIKSVSGCIDTLNSAVKNAKSVDILTSGAKVVIGGPVNAGKSTLFNTLLEKEKAIVSHIKGTTRDVIENTLNIDGIPVVLMDTAGLRKTKNIIEKIGVSKSKNEINDADLVLYLGEPGSVEKEKSGRVIYIFNKNDIKTSDKKYDVSISALKKNNIKLLKKLISERLSTNINTSNFIITSQRQLLCFKSAVNHLLKAKKILKTSSDLELAVEDLNASLSSLDLITEKTTRDDILNTVFSSFCVGK